MNVIYYITHEFKINITSDRQKPIFESKVKTYKFKIKLLNHSLVYWLLLCRADCTVHFTSRVETQGTRPKFAQTSLTEVPLPVPCQLLTGPGPVP